MLPEPSFPARPADFVGREREVEGFKAALRQSVATLRMASFAILGEWGIGKSSLLLKLADCCRGAHPPMLPVHLSISQDMGDYLRFAESLCDKLADALAASDSLTTRLRTEVRNWKFKRVNAGPLTVERDCQRFLTSGSALLRHVLTDAWRQFVRPARFAGAVFFLDDLHNLALASGDAALTIRDQFQAFGIEELNYSVCFSAKADYFSGTLSFAEPAVRFYNKLVLAPFTPEETFKYATAVFGSDPRKVQALSDWLYEKTVGHPYFLAFISRELLAKGNHPPNQLWPEIFIRLEREKFQADLAQLSEKDIALLRALAAAGEHEFAPAPFARNFQYEYFRRLTERGLLIREGRGRYKLYHPLFRAFLQQAK